MRAWAGSAPLRSFEAWLIGWARVYAAAGAAR